MTLLWTERDLEVVETLTRRVPMLSFDQVKDIWWSHGASARVVRRRLRRLARGGLVERTIANVSPPPSMTVPLLSWRPGDTEPDFVSLSALCEARRGALPVPLEIFYASRLAANLFGSLAPRLPELNHRSRDLALSQVYVHYRATRQSEAHQWIGRANRDATVFRTASPDAVIVDRDLSPVLVVHRAGRWSEHRMERFHDQCAQSQLSYELW